MDYLLDNQVGRGGDTACAHNDELQQGVDLGGVLNLLRDASGSREGNRAVVPAVDRGGADEARTCGRNTSGREARQFCREGDVGDGGFLVCGLTVSRTSGETSRRCPRRRPQLWGLGVARLGCSPPSNGQVLPHHLGVQHQ